MWVGAPAAARPVPPWDAVAGTAVGARGAGRRAAVPAGRRATCGGLAAGGQGQPGTAGVVGASDYHARGEKKRKTFLTASFCPEGIVCPATRLLFRLADARRFSAEPRGGGGPALWGLVGRRRRKFTDENPGKF